MNEDHVVEFSNVGKKYRLGEYGATTLGEELSGAWSKLVKKSQPDSTIEDNENFFWALKGLDLSIIKGDIHGIIGKNGAGKSTLLKILSRITTPTRGEVRYKGKLASLLEVGTGFHPELTGKENIYLNGAIMGMNRKETTARLSRIVEFSDCGDFINTPVKRYSSGMLVRLGFSVAAHLDSDIMIVDEVLAAGDQAFQRRCIEKMQESSRTEGKTILFVSHNFSSVMALCNRCSVIENGCSTTFNSPVDAISSYSSGADSERTREYFAPDENKPSITEISVDESLLINGTISVEVKFTSPFPIKPIPGLSICNSSMEPITATDGRVHPIEMSSGCKAGKLVCVWKNVPLYTGTYYLSAWLSDDAQDYDEKLSVLQFNLYSAGNPKTPPNIYFGMLNFQPEWKLTQH